MLLVDICGVDDRLPLGFNKLRDSFYTKMVVE